MSVSLYVTEELFVVLTDAGLLDEWVTKTAEFHYLSEDDEDDEPLIFGTVAGGFPFDGSDKEEEFVKLMRDFEESFENSIMMQLDAEGRGIENLIKIDVEVNNG